MDSTMQLLLSWHRFITDGIICINNLLKLFHNLFPWWCQKNALCRTFKDCYPDLIFNRSYNTTQLLLINI